MISRLEALADLNDEQLKEAFAGFDEFPADELMGPLAEFAVASGRPELFAHCIELAERKGLAVSLAGMRADGWFDRISTEIPNIETLCDIIGERFLAYSMILGVQIRSLASDPRFPSNSTIEFVVGDNAEQTISLVEYRVRLVQAMTQKEMLHRAELPLPLSESSAAAFVGGKLILLAPLFDISLEFVMRAGDDGDQVRALIGYVRDNNFHLQKLDEFEKELLEEIGQEIEAIAQGAFQLDLGLVEAAREAADRPDQVIELLGGWPGILSLLQRTPMGRTLESEQRTKIGEALELLADAFAQRDRDELVEELVRLGLNFVREGAVAARLFYRLARILLVDGRFAESIGLLRRGISLGAPQSEILPLLGWAFLRTGKQVAGRALLEHAAAQGWLPAELTRDLEEARGVFERAGVHWDAVE